MVSRKQSVCWWRWLTKVAEVEAGWVADEEDEYGWVAGSRRYVLVRIVRKVRCVARTAMPGLFVA